MPVRSLSSSVLKWPTDKVVTEALKQWAIKSKTEHPELKKLGYFGSYATGNWGVGSDLDLIAIVDTSPNPFEKRIIGWDLSELPVPIDLLTYTTTEWFKMEYEDNRFWQTLQKEIVWLELESD